jgi:hypothetical protein
MVITSRGKNAMVEGGWSRRGFALACVAGVGALSIGSRRAAAMQALPPDRSFAIFRDGDEIGRHDVRFRASAAGLEVATKIDIAVKVAFITAFRFGQEVLDHWQDGLLVESRVATNDNGKKSETRLYASGDNLSVEGGVANRTLRVPLGTMSDIAFWNLDIVRQRALLDLQRARLTGVLARHVGSEEIEVAGSRVATERYTINAESGRNGDIWYDAAGNWVKGTMLVRGERLDYRLIT